MRLAPRRLTVLDGMTMVAAFGAWIALSRLWVRELATQRTLLVAGWALSTLVPWTFAVLAMNLRHPRPRLWVLARQPGAVACGTAAVMLVLEVASLPLTLSTIGGGYLSSPLLVASWYWPTSVGSAVSVSWLFVIVRGRWRVEGDLISRLGVLVGFCWIALPPALMVFEFLLR